MSQAVVKKAVQIRGGDPTNLLKATSRDLAASLRKGLKEFGQRFSDLSVSVDQATSEGDTVAFQYSASAKHTGEAYGVRPTGRTVKWTGTGVARVEKGKITDLQLRDHGSWARRVQLDVVPAAGSANISGKWSADYNGICLQLNLSQGSGTSFTGTACALGNNVPVTGTNNLSASPQITIQGSEGGTSYKGTGNWTSSSQYQLTLEGFGTVSFAAGSCSGC